MCSLTRSAVLFSAENCHHPHACSEHSVCSAPSQSFYRPSVFRIGSVRLSYLCLMCLNICTPILEKKKAIYISNVFMYSYNNQHMKSNYPSILSHCNPSTVTFTHVSQLSPTHTHTPPHAISTNMTRCCRHYLHNLYWRHGLLLVGGESRE